MKIIPTIAVVASLFAWDVQAATAAAADGPLPAPTAAEPTLEPVVVTGSHIKRLEVEGPAPVTIITADDIRNSGYATVSDVMAGLTQNLGALDNNQNTDGFSPGAQAVDLRGLGPNHTLVLVNGRRIADYPQSYQGNSNFTDISNIPMSLIDHIEVLSGSASAIYGSDAIAGVINFILLKKADVTTLDFRVGDTQHGGGASQRLQLSSGYSNDRFDSVFAVEVYNQDPLWAYQRSFTNSRLDSPGDPSSLYPSPVFTRIDGDDNYIDPGKATCAALSALDRGSIIYASRPNYGNYCGSYRDVGYGTLENGKKAVNVYGSATYRLNDNTSLFLDVQAGGSHQIVYNTPLQWQNSYILDDNSTPTPFYNLATGQVEQWQRKYFTIEENGGFENGEIQNYNHTLSLNTGVKGAFGDAARWDYEFALGFSRSTLESVEPALVAAAAQALYLGPSLGVDPTWQLNEYYAPPSRLYTPLTVAQFRSITRNSVDNDTSQSSSGTFTITNSSLFRLPAGPVGFAAVADYGTQHYSQHVDPASLDGTYYGLHNTSAIGSRDHYGVGAEFKLPITAQLLASAATRYDSYSYSDTTAGKLTYQAGLEYRPIRSLLLRGSYGTGFRAPDLSFVYSGPSGSSSGGTDYYLCRLLEPQKGPDFADHCDYGDVSFDGRSIGSTALKDETSTSLTYGFAFAPTRNFELSVDYYAIRLANEVEYQSSDTILREEADCRLGQTLAGQPVNGASALCQAVDSQVFRNPASAVINPQQITSVLVLPINAAVERTTGVDINARFRFSTEHAGSFGFRFGFTEVLSHTIQLYAGDPIDNELTDYYTYVIPRYKGSYSGEWTIGRFTTTLHGALTGGLPNYDGTERLAPTMVYNGTLGYRFSEHGSLTFIVDNLFDTKPQRDPTWTSYPYYASNWFSPIGRAFFVQATYRFGGHE